MNPINQPLVWIFAGTVLGILITIGLNGSMRRARMRRYYYPRHPRIGAALATLMFFVFLAVVIAMAHSIRENKAISSDLEESNWVDQLEDEAPETPDALGWLEDKLESESPPGQERLNQSPGQGQDTLFLPQEKISRVDRGSYTDDYHSVLVLKNQGRGSPPIPSNGGHDWSEENARIYIQTLAGANRDATEREIHKYLDRFPDNTFLGISEGALPYRVLIGPYLNEMDALAAMRQLHINGFPKDVVEYKIKVHPID